MANLTEGIADQQSRRTGEGLSAGRESAKKAFKRARRTHTLLIMPSQPISITALPPPTLKSPTPSILPLVPQANKLPPADACSEPAPSFNAGEVKDAEAAGESQQTD